MEELYKAYFPDVYKYLLALTGDRQMAEELTQDTFFKALQKIEGFRGECSVRVWLCQIGKNAYLDYLKKHKRVFPADEEKETAYVRDMVQEMERKETAYRIHRILHKMSEPYKEVFTLRVFGELSFREISALFGKTESWARTTFLRAKRKIREAMENEDHM